MKHLRVGLQWLWSAAGVLGGAATGSLIRGSVWAALILGWLGSTDTWQYFASTLRAHEFRQSVPPANDNRSWQLPLVIGIDEDGYRAYFESRSPLPRDRVLKLMQVVQAHTRPGTRIALNLPVAPQAGEDPDQALLDAFWLEQPQRWVLPAWPSDPAQSAWQGKAWQERLCAHGVSFGRPDVPSEFGYPMLGYQYADAQAALLARGTSACAQATRVPAVAAQPLLPAALSANALVRFQGNLDELAQTLDLLSPEVVMIGSLTGSQGLLGTPEGERYVLQIQAAALAGAWNGECLATVRWRLLSAWALVTLLWVFMSFFLPWLDRLMKPPLSDMTGHQFVSLRGRAVSVVLVLVACLFIWVNLGALLHSATGFWVSSDLACGLTLMFTLFTWNLGRHHVKRHASPMAALRDEFLRPLQSAWGSLQSPQCRSGGRFEASWALAAFFMQGVLPWLAFAYLLIVSRGRTWG